MRQIWQVIFTAISELTLMKFVTTVKMISSSEKATHVSVGGVNDILTPRT